jgi:hypothetical protein
MKMVLVGRASVPALAFAESYLFVGPKARSAL